VTATAALAFGLLTLVSGVALAVGLGAILLDLAFDWGLGDWWTIRPMALGLIGGTIGLVGFYALSPSTPLSRGIVADKRESAYTSMVMVGKVFVPQHRVDYRLVSTEGATCSVASEAYSAYRVGDAAVCGWGK
jgi:hypothetical protein